jgi:D-3-phosphoglycerate dehydrogenase / 2-oxoglutarate reductase
MQNVILAAAISDEFTQYLLQHNCILLQYDGTAQQLQLAQGIITSTKLILDKNTLDKIPNLRWIARLGSGTEIIDLAYAASKKIFVCSSPAGIANAVAEHAIAMIISLQKNILRSANQVQLFEWSREPNRGTEISGKTIGIIGFGHTGTALANKLSVFDCNVLAFDKYKNVQHTNAQHATLDDIYANADIISYHLPLNAETIGYYNPTLFAKPHLLINTSRGAIAQTEHILQGLTTGKLIAAGLDVLDFENNYPFAETEKQYLQTMHDYGCIITPHIAGYSIEAITKMSAELQGQLGPVIFK